MKEKLQFVEKDNQALKAQLADLDAQLTANRDSLTKMKTARDTMRTKGRSIKDSSLYVTNPQLLQDMEVRGDLSPIVQLGIGYCWQVSAFLLKFATVLQLRASCKKCVRKLCGLCAGKENVLDFGAFICLVSAACDGLSSLTSSGSSLQDRQLLGVTHCEMGDVQRPLPHNCI